MTTCRPYAGLRDPFTGGGGHLTIVGRTGVYTIFRTTTSHVDPHFLPRYSRRIGEFVLEEGRDSYCHFSRKVKIRFFRQPELSGGLLSELIELNENVHM